MAIGTIVDLVGERGWTASGTSSRRAGSWPSSTRWVCRRMRPRSMAFLRALPDSGRGTGYADSVSYRAADLDAVDVARRAMQGCERNHDAAGRAARRVRGDLRRPMRGRDPLPSGKSRFQRSGDEEGRSFMSGRLGERVMGSNVTIWDDATDSRNLAAAADHEGVPEAKGAARD